MQTPTPEKEIPIQQGTPRPVTEASPPQIELGEEPGMDVSHPIRRMLYEVKDYNWEENVNLHIGKFTILGYRDATNTTDRMLFRFLTKEEHAEKRVMNSKASVLYIPPRKKSPPPKPSAETE